MLAKVVNLNNEKLIYSNYFVMMHNDNTDIELIKLAHVVCVWVNKS